MRYLPASAIIVLIIAGGPAAPAQTLKAVSGTSAASPAIMVRHVIGLEKINPQKSGKLTVQNGSMHFDGGKESAIVPVASIDGIFVGTETTQSGGTTARVVKTAAMAAPFESGKVLSILMRTKVDILTVSYRDGEGALHGAIFALPIGRGTDMRTQLIAAGARAGAPPEPELKERKQP
jgi:hypothetical protein